MEIDELLKKAKFDYNLLLEYGFIKEKDKYIYQTYIMNDCFIVDVSIYNNKLTSKVYDSNSNEEYYSVYIKDSVGPYVARVREEYYDVIKDIVDNCSSKQFFIGCQANRICHYLITKYNTLPEFLWDKYPTYGAFRHKGNNKWYALIMLVDLFKLDNINHRDIEIINIKLEENKVSELLNKKGYYKAYHMNGKHWISIILDDTIDDKVIINLIDESYINTK